MPNSLPNIHAYSTNQLVEELLTRKGVEQMTVAPHTQAEIGIDEDWDDNHDWAKVDGCARILIITD
jgi:hypothetical protein